MSNQHVLTYGNRLLREKALPVETIDEAVMTRLNTMTRLMHTHSGVGLAGNQIGVLQRLITVLHPETEQTFALINPEIIECGSEKDTEEEGCLSIPEIFSKVERPRRVWVRALDSTGAVREIEAEGLLARIFLHEIDHLDGILFVDRLAPTRRLLLSKRLRKFSGEGE